MWLWCESEYGVHVCMCVCICVRRWCGGKANVGKIIKKWEVSFIFRLMTSHTYKDCKFSQNKNAI